MSKPWTLDEMPDQSGRVAVVTGANSGLGRVTARELARRGAHVIATARDRTKGDQAAAEIRESAPGASIEVGELDLASLDSVRRFADSLGQAQPRIDLLVNNAGIMMPPRSETAEGFELQFGTNHLGHFALTGLLLPKLGTGTDPRVITVSSIEHKPGKLNWDDLQSERRYSPRGAYQQSKFANAVFAIELDRRLRAAGSPVASILAHPGYSDTNLQKTGPTGLMKGILSIGNRVMAQGAGQGALPQLYAATMPGVKGGEFIGPDGPREFRGSPTHVEPVDRAKDEETGRRLWEVSERLTGVTYPLPGPTAA